VILLAVILDGYFRHQIEFLGLAQLLVVLATGMLIYIQVRLATDHLVEIRKEMDLQHVTAVKTALQKINESILASPEFLKTSKIDADEIRAFMVLHALETIFLAHVIRPLQRIPEKDLENFDPDQQAFIGRFVNQQYIKDLWENPPNRQVFSSSFRALVARLIER
jgi:hypothetical protein